jgi:type I restriction enzyme S subunit
MNSPAGTEQVRRVEYGAAQKQFNISDAIDFIFPTPPKQEQDEIAQYVDNMLKKFSELQTTISKQIQLLKERRTALISAAVTGKIDVRDQVPQDDEAIAS